MVEVAKLIAKPEAKREAEEVAVEDVRLDDDSGAADAPPGLGDPPLPPEDEMGILVALAPARPGPGGDPPALATPPVPNSPLAPGTPASHDSYGQLDDQANEQAIAAHANIVWEVNEDSYQLFTAEALSARGKVIMSEKMVQKFFKMNRTSSLAAKRRTEVRWKDLTVEQKKGLRKAIGAEWQSCIDTGSAKVISKEKVPKGTKIFRSRCVLTLKELKLEGIPTGEK